MHNKRAPCVVIQAEPNFLKIEYARLALDDHILNRLREMYAMLSAHKLISLSTDALPVQWVRNGLVLHEQSTICEVFEGGLGISSHFLGAINAKGVFDQSSTICGTWFFGDISDLDYETILERANEKGEIFEEALGLSSLDQI